MMMRNFWGENLFDEWMEDAFAGFADMDRNLYGKHAKNMMKTDVQEQDSGYQVAIELPGFEKSEISAELQNGSLTITAAKSLDKDEQDKSGKYIRRERYSGTMQRSFYVGDGVRQEDIRAEYKNGVLKLEIPKVDANAVSQNKYIAIEG
ncbi:MAG: Hsp20/alpha crystallin family protein [Candidatus Gastranaerophilales bacterium]|nr:Hsp20/alpha crystallin family protein [Candidatus Gastranaerophilales bacterium]